MAVGQRSGAGTNQGHVRRHNLGTLLGHVHHSEQISRAELTARMALNRSTIAGLVAELEALGVVIQVSPTGDRTGAGRPSNDVRPGGREVFVLAIELGVERISVARVGLGGQILARASALTPSSRTPEDVSTAIADLSRDLVLQSPPDALLVGAGLGLPGVVGSDDGLVSFAPNLGWTNVPFGRLLRDRLGDTVTMSLGNDADLGVLSEHIRGAGRGHSDVVYLSGDVGVGGGVVAGGAMLTGAGGYAGEVGHLRVRPDGRTCRCGSRGCWETEIGAHAVAMAVGSGSDDLEELARCLESVQEPSDALVEVGRNLGIGLANIVNVFNPEVIILGGLLRSLYPVVRRIAQQTMAEGALDAAYRQTCVVLPGLGGSSVIMGAAELAFGALLLDPVDVLSATNGSTQTLLSSSAS